MEADWIQTTRTEAHVRMDALNLEMAKVPNVKGMGARDAIYLLENAGLDVKVIGRGNVREQSLQPGLSIRRGMKITLTMSIVGSV
jgi:cell division protein FtsI (penicillin-binding protein 3)